MGKPKFSARRVWQSLALWLGLVALTIQGLVPLCVASAATAPAGAALQSMVICTAHGYVTVQLDAEGNPVPSAPPSDHGTTCFLCLACHMAPGFTAPALAQWLIPAATERESARLASAAMPTRPQHLSYVSRAPPASSGSLTA